MAQILARLTLSMFALGILLLLAAPLDTASADGVTDIATGDFHTCALVDETVMCAGTNQFGQVGDGTFTSPRLLPANVTGLVGPQVGVSAGGSQSCAISVGGALKCWGFNYYGKLGDGNTDTYSPVAVDVAGLSSGVASVSLGLSHTCAVKTSGNVKCWGKNNYGQLGDGSFTSRSTPVDVIGLTATSVAAGLDHTCAINAAGGVECWGENTFEQLGNGPGPNSPIPIPVAGLPSGVVAIDAGERFTCAITGSLTVKCWGNYPPDGSSPTTPTEIPGAPGGITALAAGARHACVSAGGAVSCWGQGSYGQIGNGTTGYTPFPEAVIGLAGVTAIEAGGAHTCAITSTGLAKCWGLNGGSLGNGESPLRTTPADAIYFKAAAVPTPTTTPPSVGGLALDPPRQGDGNVALPLIALCAATAAGASAAWRLRRSVRS